MRVFTSAVFAAKYVTVLGRRVMLAQQVLGFAVCGLRLGFRV